ncbi:hypothetical protein VTK73DRAFT_4694 [Phialemonium thermophilum]|uniref:Uncharacterized protein n=1 Tax=Phialemonium thermophilum TaxID=223376 RepID=A0ABR3V6P8_9PEZI
MPAGHCCCAACGGGGGGGSGCGDGGGAGICGCCHDAVLQEMEKPTGTRRACRWAPFLATLPRSEGRRDVEARHGKCPSRRDPLKRSYSLYNMLPPRHHYVSRAILIRHGRLISAALAVLLLDPRQPAFSFHTMRPSGRVRAVILCDPAKGRG